MKHSDINELDEILTLPLKGKHKGAEINLIWR